MECSYQFIPQPVGGVESGGGLFGGIFFYLLLFTGSCRKEKMFQNGRRQKAVASHANILLLMNKYETGRGGCGTIP